jgi:polyisoprenyl-phosphate glycosyltransferase
MLLTFLLPVHNESSNIDTIIRRIFSTCENVNFEFVILCVDDGSVDDSLEQIKAWSKKDGRVQFMSFTQNFGHQIAVMAGLQSALGDYVLVMDSDGQDPPELVHEMLAKASEGFDMVLGVRNKRDEMVWKQIMYRFYYRLLNFFTESPIPLDSGDFCLYSRLSVEHVTSFREQNPFLRGLRVVSGLPWTSVRYDRPARLSGEPSYTLKGLFSLGLNGIISFSYKPLRIATSFGIGMMGLSFLGIIIYLISWVTNFQLFSAASEYPTGFTTLVIMLLGFSGLQLMFLGIIGEYMWRMFAEVKGRPQYWIKEKSGIQENNN